MKKHGSAPLRSRTSTELKPLPTAPYCLGMPQVLVRTFRNTRRNVMETL